MAGRHHLGHVRRLDHDLGVRHELARLGVPRAAEAEHRRRIPKPLGEVRQRGDPDPAADEQRPLDVEPEAVAEWAEDRDPVSGLERAERARAGPDRVDQEAELVAGREREAHRPRQQPARRSEHEELSRAAGLDLAAFDS